MQHGAVGKLTYRDYVRFPDDGLRHELIDGVHYMTPSPTTPHQRLSRRLLVALTNYLESTGRGEVFSAPFDVVLSDHDVVEPDLVVVLAGQSEIVTRQHVRGAPAIVIEILSPATAGRDRGLKRELYGRRGVREYWLVDPDERSLNVCGLDRNGALLPVGQYCADRDDRLSSALLPDFDLSMLELFSRLE